MWHHIFPLRWNRCQRYPSITYGVEVFQRILQVQMLCNKGKRTLLLRSQHRYNLFFYKNVQFFELSPDRSYFLASFSLEMFLRMFLNFSNGNLMTLKDQAKIVVVTLMNCTCTEYNINVLLTIHNKNVLKEQNFACILIYGIMSFIFFGFRKVKEVKT